MFQEVALEVPDRFVPCYDLLDEPVTIELDLDLFTQAVGEPASVRLMVLDPVTKLAFVDVPSVCFDGRLATRHPFAMFRAQSTDKSRDLILIWSHLSKSISEGFPARDPKAPILVEYFLTTMALHQQNVPFPCRLEGGKAPSRHRFLEECENEIRKRTGLCMALMEARHIRTSDHPGALGFTVREPSDEDVDLWRRIAGRESATTEPEGMIAITRMGMELEDADRFDLILHEVAHIVVDHTIRGMHLTISEPNHGLAWAVACGILETIFDSQVDGTEYVAKRMGDPELEWWLERLDDEAAVAGAQEKIVSFVGSNLDRSQPIASEVDRLADLLDRDWHATFCLRKKTAKS